MNLLLAGAAVAGVYIVMRNAKKSGGAAFPEAGAFTIAMGDMVFETSDPSNTGYVRERRVAANGKNEYLITHRIDDDKGIGLWYYENQLTKL